MTPSKINTFIKGEFLEEIINGIQMEINEQLGKDIFS